MSEEGKTEPLSARYLRIARENEELYCNLAEAEVYMMKYAGLNEGDPEKMLELGRFFLRIGKLEKADQYLRDAFSFQIKNQKMGLLYASYLLQLSRTREAIVILNKLQLEGYEPIFVNLLLSFAYEQDQDPLLSSKFKSLAYIHRIRQLDMLASPGSGLDNKPQAIPPANRPVTSGGAAQQEESAHLNLKVESAPGFGNHRLNPQQEDELYLSLAKTLSENSVWGLARKVI